MRDLASSIARERGPDAAPPPRLVPRVEEEQVIVIEPADYPAVAGPAGVTVPIEIDGAETRLRAEPGELLIVAAQRFMAAHLTATSGIGCDVGDQLCMIVRLYDALRQFDERRKAEAAPAAPRAPAAVALAALAGVVAALVACLAPRRSASAAAGRAAAADGARAAFAEVIEAQRTQISQLSAQLEELRQHNELLKSQLKEAGVSAIEKVVSLDEAKERLRAAAARLLGAQGGGYDDEKEVERWDAYIRVHPDHAAEQLAAEATWRADHATANEACRRVVRGFVPPDVFRSGASLASLKSDGLSADAARRVFKHPALWLTRAAPKRIAKCHVADLRGRYAFETLSLLELRAVFASLPEDGAFENDARGDKQAWKASLAAKLKSLAARKADLPPPKRAPALRRGRGLGRRHRPRRAGRGPRRGRAALLARRRGRRRRPQAAIDEAAEASAGAARRRAAARGDGAAAAQGGGLPRGARGAVRRGRRDAREEEAAQRRRNTVAGASPRTALASILNTAALPERRN
ncbi:hypothetical protein JL722_3204 [Aureococcus anophagefferens]|nr:hypothetical protein JL722_3204 [Aureococcus anophagefferens]